VTRAASFDSTPIAEAGHAAWLATRLADADSRLWIAEDHDGPWGLVRFQVDGAGAEIGVSIGAGHRGRGLAAPLIRAGVRRLFSERDAVDLVTASIRPENGPSISAFGLAGFTRSDGVDPVRFVAERADGW
jgi:RimJ/RimL family protein N-acetyltransferase